ncbi:MAG: hypothetical protein GXO42_02995 [bacterium]|nr:hypothetical protein [bacterium]
MHRIVVCLLLSALIVISAAYAQTAVPTTFNESTWNYQVIYIYNITNSSNLSRTVQVLYSQPLFSSNTNTTNSSNVSSFHYLKVYFGNKPTSIIKDVAVTNISTYIGVFWACINITPNLTKYKLNASGNQYIFCLVPVGLGTCNLRFVNGRPLKLCKINLSPTIYSIYPWINITIEDVEYQPNSTTLELNYSWLAHKQLDTQHLWIIPLYSNSNINSSLERHITLILNISPLQAIKFNSSVFAQSDLVLRRGFSTTEITVHYGYGFPVFPHIGKKLLVYPVPVRFKQLYPKHIVLVVPNGSYRQGLINHTVYNVTFNITIAAYNPLYAKSRLLSNHVPVIFTSKITDRTRLPFKTGLKNRLLELVFQNFTLYNITLNIIFNESYSQCNFTLNGTVYIVDNATNKTLATLTPIIHYKQRIFTVGGVHIKVYYYNVTIPYLPKFSAYTLIKLPVHLTCINLEPPQLYVNFTVGGLASQFSFSYLGRLNYRADLVYAFTRPHFNHTTLFYANLSTDLFLIDKNQTKTESERTNSTVVYLYKAYEAPTHQQWFKLIIHYVAPPRSLQHIYVYYYNASSGKKTLINRYCQISTGGSEVTITCNITGFNITLYRDRIIVKIPGTGKTPFCAYVYEKIFVPTHSGYTTVTSLKDKYCTPSCIIKILDIIYNNRVHSDTHKKLFFALGDWVTVHFVSTCPAIKVFKNCSQNGCYPLSRQEKLNCSRSGTWWYCNLTANITTIPEFFTKNYYIFGSTNVSALNRTNPRNINIENLPDYITREGAYVALPVYRLVPRKIFMYVPYYAKLNGSGGVYTTSYYINYTYVLPRVCTAVCSRIPVYAKLIDPFNFSKNVNVISSVQITATTREPNVTIILQPQGSGNIIPYRFILDYASAPLKSLRVLLHVRLTGQLDWPMIYYSPNATLEYYVPGSSVHYNFRYVYGKNLSLTYNYTILPVRWVIPYYISYAGVFPDSPIFVLVVIPFYIITNETVPRVVITVQGTHGHVVAHLLNVTVFPPANVTVVQNEIFIRNWQIPLITGYRLFPAVSFIAEIVPAAIRPPGTITLNVPKQINLTSQPTPVAVHGAYRGGIAGSFVHVFCFPNNTFDFYAVPEHYSQSGVGSGSYGFVLNIYRHARTIFANRLFCGAFLTLPHYTVPIRVTLAIYSPTMIKHRQVLPFNGSAADAKYPQVIFQPFNFTNNGVCIGYDVKNVSIIINNTLNATINNVSFIFRIDNGTRQFYGARILKQVNASCRITVHVQQKEFVLNCSRFGPHGSVVVQVQATQDDRYEFTFFNITVRAGIFSFNYTYAVPNCGRPIIYFFPSACHTSVNSTNLTLAVLLVPEYGYPWAHNVTATVQVCGQVYRALFDNAQVGHVFAFRAPGRGSCSVSLVSLTEHSRTIPASQYRVIYKCGVVGPGSVELRSMFPAFVLPHDTASLDLALLGNTRAAVQVVRVQPLAPHAQYKELLGARLNPAELHILGLVNLPKPANGSQAIAEADAVYGETTLARYYYVVGQVHSKHPVSCTVFLRMPHERRACNLSFEVVAREVCSDNHPHPFALMYSVYSYNGTIRILSVSRPLICDNFTCIYTFRINVTPYGTFGYIFFQVVPVDWYELKYSCSTSFCQVLVNTSGAINITVVNFTTRINSSTVYQWCYCPGINSTIVANITNLWPVNFYHSVVNFSFLHAGVLLSNKTKIENLLACSRLRVNTTFIPTYQFYPAIYLNVSVLYNHQLLGYKVYRIPQCPHCATCFKVNGSVHGTLGCSDWSLAPNYLYYVSRPIEIVVHVNVSKNPACPAFRPYIYVVPTDSHFKDAYRIVCRIVSEQHYTNRTMTYINYTIIYSCRLYRLVKPATIEQPRSVVLLVFFRPSKYSRSWLLGRIVDACPHFYRLCYYHNQRWLYDAMDVAEKFVGQGVHVSLVKYICGFPQRFVPFLYHECFVDTPGGWIDLHYYRNCTYSIPLAEVEYVHPQYAQYIQRAISRVWFRGGIEFPWTLSSAGFAGASCSNLSNIYCLHAILTDNKFYRPTVGTCCGNCGGSGACSLVHGYCMCIPHVINPCFKAAVLVCAYRVLSGQVGSCAEACRLVVNPTKAISLCYKIVSQLRSINKQGEEVRTVLQLFSHMFVLMPNGRPWADMYCDVGYICKLIATRNGIAFRAGFRAGQCVPAALQFGVTCPAPAFEYYVSYQNFTSRCEQWFNEHNLAVLYEVAPRVCQYIRTGCNIHAGGTYVIAYNLTHRGTSGSFGYAASCGGYPCSTLNYVEQLYIVYFNGSGWMWCRVNTSQVPPAGQCTQLASIIGHYGGLEQAIDNNSNIKLIKVKVPISMRNQVVISFSGTNIYLLGQVKLPSAATKVFAVITPNHKILLQWVLLRKPRYIPAVPETGNFALFALAVILLSVILYRKKLQA